MSFHEINLAIQTFWTSLVLLSMWFRLKGKYLAQEITMIIVVAAAFISFSAVLLGPSMSSSSLQIYFNSPWHLRVFSLHGILSTLAIVFGSWLVALWRPQSLAFVTKSKKIAKITLILWITAYFAGILAFLVFHTPLFG